MCGIVGAVSNRNVVAILVEGLQRLEYRGYDSCGLAVVDQLKGLQKSKTTARVEDLNQNSQHFYGTMGIAHTRWATHGKPNTDNAHPHFSGNLIGVVHNGIIENFEALRQQLQEKGYRFESQTDTEVIAHLIYDSYIKMEQKDLVTAVRQVLPQLHGAYAIAVLSVDEPNLLVGARVGSPLVIAYGDQENFLASDALAVARHATKMTYLEEGDIVALHKDAVQILDINGKSVQRSVREVPQLAASVE